MEVAGGLVLVRVIERARGTWLPDGPVVALDAATGRVRWERGWASAAFATGPAGLPVVSATTVYVPSTGPTIHALELASGRERWSARIASGENPAAVVPVEGGVVAAVRIDEQPGDRSRAHERVVRLASRDGTELWRSDRARGGFWSLTVDAARVYVATVPLNGGPPTTYALDRETGATRWSARHLSSLTPIGASLIGFGRADSDYYAVRVDPRSGKEASSRVPLSPPSTGVQPVETGDPAVGRAAIASDEARLSLVTRDGRVAWSTIVVPDAPCGIFRHADTPSISGHVAYVVVSDERTICEG
ncbi:MAG: PQQ-binding-like beta-propeller repeat protein [Thermoleophilia bacterium]